jgi:hypothetical protein
LLGNSSDIFVINVTSSTAQFILSRSQIILSGGLTANHVLLYIPGTEGMLNFQSRNGGEWDAFGSAAGYRN